MIDTYEAVQQLKAAGLTEDQAGAVVKVVNANSDRLATKTDLERRRLAALQAATKADMAALQAATKADLLDLQVKLMATQIAVAALIIAAIKLF